MGYTCWPTSSVLQTQKTPGAHHERHIYVLAIFHFLHVLEEELAPIFPLCLDHGYSVSKGCDPRHPVHDKDEDVRRRAEGSGHDEAAQPVQEGHHTQGNAPDHGIRVHGVLSRDDHHVDRGAEDGNDDAAQPREQAHCCGLEGEDQRFQTLAATFFPDFLSDDYTELKRLPTQVQMQTGATWKTISFVYPDLMKYALP